MDGCDRPIGIGIAERHENYGMWVRSPPPVPNTIHFSIPFLKGGVAPFFPPRGRFWSGAWQRLERRLIGVHGEFSHWPEQVIATGIEHRSKEHQEFSGPRDEMRGPRDGSGWQICTTERKIGNPPSDVQASPDGLGRAAQSIFAPRNCPSKKGEENV